MRRIADKKRFSLNALRNNNNSLKETDQKRLNELKQKLKIFGIGGNVLEKLEEFRDMIK